MHSEINEKPWKLTENKDTEQKQQNHSKWKQIQIILWCLFTEKVLLFRLQGYCVNFRGFPSFTVISVYSLLNTQATGADAVIVFLGKSVTLVAVL